MTTRGLRIAFAASFVLGGALGAVACNDRKTSETAADARALAEAGMTTEADSGAGTEAGSGPDASAATETTSDAATAVATASTTGATDGGAKHAADASGGGSSGSIETAAHGGDGGAKASAVAIDESAAGKTVELAAGQSLTLSLGANATTGFDWSVTKAPAALGTPDLTYVQGGSQPGAPGTRRLTWTLKSALPAGEHAVELAYARSFEKGVAPFKTFKLKVRAAR